MCYSRDVNLRPNFLEQLKCTALKNFKKATLIAGGTASSVSERHILHMQVIPCNEDRTESGWTSHLDRRLQSTLIWERDSATGLGAERDVGDSRSATSSTSTSAYPDHTKTTRGEQTKRSIKCCHESQAPQEVTDAPGHNLMYCALAYSKHLPIIFPSRT